VSTALYLTRLYWAGGRGIAKLNGREVRLGGPPHLPDLKLDAIDYAPCGVVAMVMPRREGWRDMTAGEIAQCLALLVELTKEMPRGDPP
jgi:hypothetical protein